MADDLARAVTTGAASAVAAERQRLYPGTLGTAADWMDDVKVAVAAALRTVAEISRTEFELFTDAALIEEFADDLAARVEGLDDTGRGEHR